MIVGLTTVRPRASTILVIGMGALLWNRRDEIVVGIVEFVRPYWSATLVFAKTRLQQARAWALGYFGSPTGRDDRIHFREALFPASKLPKNHTHPHAAAERASADLCINAIAEQMDGTLFSLSDSNRDAKARIPGNHAWYDPKDCVRPVHGPLSIPSDATIIKMVDVDYFVEMNSLLTVPRTVLLYTFSPRRPAGSMKDGVFTTLADGRVSVRVNGGAEYVHPVWDYDRDIFVAHGLWRSVVYRVERRGCGPDSVHELVMLEPVCVLWSIVARLMWPGAMLHRRNSAVDCGEWTVTCVRTQDPVPVYHLSLPGSYSCVTVEETIVESVRTRVNPATVTPQVVSGYLRASEICRALPDQNLAAGILHKMVVRGNYAVPQRIPAADGLGKYESHYTIVGRDTIEHGSPAMVILHKPLLAGGVSPTNCWENDVVCAFERYTKVFNGLDPDHEFTPYLNEFVEYLIPTPGMLKPLDIETVRDLQVRDAASLRKAERFWPILFTEVMQASKLVVKCFQKAESYGKAGAPRNIVPVPYETNLRLAAFIYPVAELLYEQSWYAFGHSPKEVAETVVTLAAEGLPMCLKDFSKFDGSSGEQLEALWHAVLFRAYGPEYIQEILTLYDFCTGGELVSKFGVAVVIFCQILSGRYDTGCGNTGRNAAIDWVTLRVGGYKREEIPSLLGVYGGDDGAIPLRVAKDLFISVCARFGISLKIDVVAFGGALHFLGRYYFKPAEGPWNIADVKRQLLKLHQSAVYGVKPVPGMLNKARSLLVTDPNTPILGAYARVVVERFGKLPTRLERGELDLSWHARSGLPFDIPGPEWKDEIRHMVAEQLGMTVDAIDACELMLQTRHHTQWDDSWTEIPAAPVIDFPCLVGALAEHSANLVVDEKSKILEGTEPRFVEMGNMIATMKAVNKIAKKKATELIESGHPEALKIANLGIEPKKAPKKKSEKRATSRKSDKPKEGVKKKWVKADGKTGLKTPKKQTAAEEVKSLISSTVVNG